jgi:hypothetical protein
VVTSIYEWRLVVGSLFRDISSPWLYLQCYSPGYTLGAPSILVVVTACGHGTRVAGQLITNLVDRRRRRYRKDG